LGVYYSATGVPYISKADLDDEATIFLDKFHPLALQYASSVPVVQIAADMGITMIFHERLTEDFSVYGQMCFSDGGIDIYHDMEDEYVELHVTDGTMLIDPNTKLTRNIGCFNNTVAHELFHWYRHRDYFVSQSQQNGRTVVATRCNRDQIEGRTYGRRYTDIDWIEWQASSIAPRILMPYQTFERAAEKAYADNRYYYRSDKRVYSQTIHDLMDIYNVSFTSAAIRFEELGLKRLLR
jgi:hypothetical protein